MSHSPLIKKLIDALCCLPGVGPKTAQRMAIQLLEKQRDAAITLSSTLAEAVELVGHCEKCRTLTEQPVCHICSSPRRDSSLLCVVENPSDVFAIEQSGEYQGNYFVLMGHLSPIDGIGPEDIGLDKLLQRMELGEVSELILATSTTVEGEATAFYIREQLSALNISVTRIAYGVPMGGELEFVDGGTIGRALAGRAQF